MKIEAITVSVNYVSHLQQIISNNKEVDRWIIVTDKDDVLTRFFCRKNKLECITTDRLYDGATFAKGRAINDGLKYLDKDDWILHIDSDIQLPENFKSQIINEVDEKDHLYFCRRYSPDSPIDVDQKRWMTRPPITDELPDLYKCMNQRLGFDNRIDTNYKPRPFGYFQLWHSSQLTQYSEESTNADFDDVNTSYHFFPKWELLDDLKVLDVNPWDSNWDGIK
jgi:glycosyltransferase involved in cell wall biosynthesis